VNSTRTWGVGGLGGVALAAIAFLVGAPSVGADVGRANLDGSHADSSFIATPDRAGSPSLGVAVDGQHVYWSSDNDDAQNEVGAIGRAKLDGSGVVQRFIAAPEPTGVAVGGAHVYWGSDQSIWRANLNGSGASNLIAEATPLGIAVGAQHLYWIADPGQKFPSDVARANLDGSEVEPELISLINGGEDVAGVAVAGGHVYWSGRDAIGRANLDGSNADPNFIAAPDLHLGVAVDGEHVYWSNFQRGTIGRANLDGSGVDPDFITGAGCAAGVAVDVAHVYWSNEGACSDHTVKVAIRCRRVRLDGPDATMKLKLPADEASPPIYATVRLKTRKRIHYRGERRRVTLAQERSVRIGSQVRIKRIELRLSKAKARLVRKRSEARSVRAIAHVSDQAGNEKRVAKRMRLIPRG
jgi:hypothetical protein